jgi:hypothetical protein
MKSYVKIFGPPIGKAIVALRKVAVETPEVCIMDTGIAATLDSASYSTSSLAGAPALDTMEGVQTFFGGAEAIPEERCDTIISKSGESLGEYDFFFEWFQTPTVAMVEDLILKIDEALTDVGVRYTLTTK